MAEKMTGPYRWLKAYIRFLVDRIFYKDVYCIDVENVPETGKPLLIVSDHQNSLNDALGILLAINDRKVHFITRADVFRIHPLASKFLYWIGLLPAFRIAFEGEEALSNNDATFRISEADLLAGKTVVIYPEAGHQDKRWLGKFSYGYTRMAFETAEMGGFETEIFILPSCNHYSEYHGMRTQSLVRFGTPISLQPFYALYKEKPRTAQREVNKLVREQIKGMMLSIDDLEHYEEIDYLRQTEFGTEYALSHGFDPRRLPDKLSSDRQLVAALAGCASETEAIYRDVRRLIEGTASLGIEDRNFVEDPSAGRVLLRCLLLVILLPLALVCVWPSLPCWFIPKIFVRKTGDRMLYSTFEIALNVLFLLPIAAVITLAVTWAAAGAAAALVYTALIPLICCFEWAYYTGVRKMVTDIRYRYAKKKGKIRPLEELRRSVYAGLSGLLGFDL